MKYRPETSWDLSTLRRNSKGYWTVASKHPKARRGRYLYHRLVMEAEMGRVLESYEEVHHLLPGKDVNTPDALFVVYRKEHRHAHKMLGE